VALAEIYQTTPLSICDEVLLRTNRCISLTGCGRIQIFGKLTGSKIANFDSI